MNKIASGNDPNIQLLFHGTSSLCEFLQTLDVNHLCDHGRENIFDCGLCGIALESFRVDRIGRTRRPAGAWQRFGDGFYFSKHSSKCHFYGKVGERYSSNGRRYRVMYQCNVALGLQYTPEHADTSIRSPPDGYHSVKGAIGRGGGRGHGSLNYEEDVVYTPAACLPRYLIVYSYDSSTE